MFFSITYVQACEWPHHIEYYASLMTAFWFQDLIAIKSSMSRNPLSLYKVFHIVCNQTIYMTVPLRKFMIATIV